MSAGLAAAPVPRRPFGVTVLAALATISAVLWLLALPTGILFAALGALEAYGLWNLRPWGRILAIALWALATFDALVLLSNGIWNTNLVVGPVAVLYLLRADIRAAFDGPGS